MGTLFDDMETFKKASEARINAMEEMMDAFFRRLTSLEHPETTSPFTRALLAEDAQERAPEVPPLPDHPRFRYFQYLRVPEQPKRVAQFDVTGRGTWVDMVNLIGANLEHCIAVALRHCEPEDDVKWEVLEQRLKK